LQKPAAEQAVKKAMTSTTENIVLEDLIKNALKNL
jgi:hypothetical protein